MRNVVLLRVSKFFYNVVQVLTYYSGTASDANHFLRRCLFQTHFNELVY